MCMTCKKTNGIVKRFFMFAACVSFLLFLLIFHVKIDSYAYETIANLSRFKGNVELVRGSMSTPISPGMPILSTIDKFIKDT